MKAAPKKMYQPLCLSNQITQFFYSCNNKYVWGFFHHYSAVQVDVFTVVYKRFDSLVSGKRRHLSPLNLQFP